VLTHADSCRQPYCDQTVGEWLAHAFEALIINRRTVDAGCACNRAIAAAELGETHLGRDCVVFPASGVRDVTPSDSDSVIGAGLVMRSLLAHLVYRAMTIDQQHWSVLEHTPISKAPRSRC